METVAPLISAIGEDATIHTRVLGGRNPVTRFPAVTWTDTAVKIMIDETGSRDIEEASGRVTVITLRAFVAATVTVEHLDRLTYHGELYEVATIPTTEYLHGLAAFKRLQLVQVTS